MAERGFAIVVGYLAGDELPDDARRLGLLHRVAFALDSFEQNADDGSTFDAELAGALLAAVQRVVSADRLDPANATRTTDLEHPPRVHARGLVRADPRRGSCGREAHEDGDPRRRPRRGCASTVTERVQTQIFGTTFR